MPRHTRTIYSRRQRMAPGQYDTPLADFLDRLPDYFNQYQQNQLAIDRQRLAEKRYDDAIKQQNFRNELSLIKELPESARAKAMLSSENEDIQEAGRISEAEANAFNAMLNPSDMSEPENQQLEYYKNLLNNPSVRNNQARINQVKGKIKSINNSLLQSQVQEWYNSNKDNPNAKIILQQSQYDPSGAIKNITSLKDPKEREIIKGGDGYNYYADTKERVLPEVTKQPPLTGVIRGLTSALSSLDRELFFDRARMTADEVSEKEREREALLTQIKSLTLDNQAGGLRIPTTDSAPAESTKINIPGLTF